MYIAALKQCLAMFFLLLALPYAIDKKYAQFYLLVLVAIFSYPCVYVCHCTVAFGKTLGKVSWGLLGATAFAMATYDFTLGAFMEYAQSIGALVAEVEVLMITKSISCAFWYIGSRLCLR